MDISCKQQVLILFYSSIGLGVYILRDASPSPVTAHTPGGEQAY